MNTRGISIYILNLNFEKEKKKKPYSNPRNRFLWHGMTITEESRLSHDGEIYVIDARTR